MEEIKKRVIHQGSYIIENTFVNEEFKYGAQNNMRNYLEFENKEEMARKMEELFNDLDSEE